MRNIPFEKHLTDHISNLEENPNLMLIESLLQVYQENQPLVKVLCDLFDWDPQTDPLANFAQCVSSVFHLNSCTMSKEKMRN